ncbi:MAG: hypothetical protein HYY14_05085 [Candidatus Omnitrophica bacterium]|nr:hypothetical protein [Candidatus Omnitrophota bacterium]
MRPLKPSRYERGIETALVKGEYINVSPAKFHAIARAVQARRKDAVLNIRVNSADLKSIKMKARRLGIKYQSFISELLHRVAHS